MITIFTLAVISIIIILLIKVPVFYLLVKFFDKKVKFLTSLKTLLIFELLYFIFACIYFKPIYSSVWLSILTTFGIIVISCLIFYLSNRLTKLIDWKRGIALFIIMVLIVTPIISYLVTRVMSTIEASDELMELSNESIFLEMNILEFVNMIINPPLKWKIIGKVQDSVGNNLLLRHLQSIRFNIAELQM